MIFCILLCYILSKLLPIEHLYSVIRHSDRFAEQIHSAVFTVVIYRHPLTVDVVKTKHSGIIIGSLVSLIPRIPPAIDKDPMLAFPHSQHVCLFIQLYLVGILVLYLHILKPIAHISAAADQCPAAVLIGIGACICRISVV